ncbi:LemA family protein [Candidatus Pacearchaeota archaeon]|nr:LemA family protein [Candidatus Pacearchaeota archaeon]|tara:strand:- start:480 stop:1082 length:603 start_codon:yes stop_codon:yes gene_type:complete
MNRNRMAKSNSKKWWIIGIVVVVLLFFMIFIGKYNSFITLEQNVDSKWSSVENQYQRQADLIPNLVSVVSSSVGAETEFVKDVTAARTAWASAGTQLAKDRAGTQMNNGISAFVSAVAENYPVLQANKQYIALTDELSGTQNRVANSRREYIEAIQFYNTATKRFPGNIIAGMFGFEEKEYYTADEGSLDTPTLGTGQLP